MFSASAPGLEGRWKLAGGETAGSVVTLFIRLGWGGGTMHHTRFPAPLPGRMDVLRTIFRGPRVRGRLPPANLHQPSGLRTAGPQRNEPENAEMCQRTRPGGPMEISRR